MLTEGYTALVTAVNADNPGRDGVYEVNKRSKTAPLVWNDRGSNFANGRWSDLCFIFISIP